MQDLVHISASLFDPEFSFSQSRCNCANKRDRSVPTCRKSGLNTGCLTVCAVGPFPGGGGGVLPNIGYIGMCRCEGYGFRTVGEFTLV